MKVDRISVSLRFSEDYGEATCRTMELSAEGTIDQRETWQQATATLRQQLESTFNQLWKPKPPVAAGPAPSMAPSMPTLPAPSMATEPAHHNGTEHWTQHWCVGHQKEWKLKTNKQTGVTFYSHHHQANDPPWCNEPTE